MGKIFLLGTMMALIAPVASATGVATHLLELAPVESLAGHWHLRYENSIAYNYGVAISVVTESKVGSHSDQRDTSQQLIFAGHWYPRVAKVPGVFLQAGLGLERRINSYRAPRDALTYQFKPGHEDVWQNELTKLHLRPGVGWRSQPTRYVSYGAQLEWAYPIFVSQITVDQDVGSPQRQLKDKDVYSPTIDVAMFIGFWLP